MEREEKNRQERVGSVTANPDNLEIRKEAGGEAKGTQGLTGPHAFGPKKNILCPKY